MSQPRLLLLARSTGLLGGLSWLARWVLGSGAAAGTAYWLGLVALVVSLAAYGAALVKVGWLQVVVGLALPVLVWSVLEVLRGGGDGLAVDGLAGLVVLLVAGVGLARSRSGSGSRVVPSASASRRGTRRTGTGAHTR